MGGMSPNTQEVGEREVERSREVEREREREIGERERESVCVCVCAEVFLHTHFDSCLCAVSHYLQMALLKIMKHWYQTEAK